MGNKLSRKRQLVDERYTRPQGLYPNNDVDQKKLKKLILDSKLAPCYPGDEDCAFDLEECPICFLYYPSLNRSRCCTKGICTECFLQMKPPHATRPTQCPFCKTCNYAVEYRGMRSKEEKGIEQVEEQRVIEAKIRMQQQEILEDEERTKRRLETSSSRRIVTPDEVGYRDLSSSSHAVPSYNIPVGSDEIDSSHDSQTSVLSRQPSQLRQNRGDQFDVDLEDLMVMEAIWLSIQENGTQRLLTCGDAAAPEHANEDHYAFPAVATTSQAPSPSGGLACAIAALAERQHMDRDPTTDPGNTSTPDMHPESCGSAAPDEETDGYASESWVDISADSRAAFPREEGEWGTDIGSEVAEAGTSYASSDATVELRAGAIPMPNSVVDHCQHNILPETFEEQMMLAMAVSLTDARARSNSQGVAWL